MDNLGTSATRGRRSKRRGRSQPLIAGRSTGRTRRKNKQEEDVSCMTCIIPSSRRATSRQRQSRRWRKGAQWLAGGRAANGRGGLGQPPEQRERSGGRRGWRVAGQEGRSRRRQLDSGSQRKKMECIFASIFVFQFVFISVFCLSLSGLCCLAAAICCYLLLSATIVMAISTISISYQLIALCICPLSQLTCHPPDRVNPA